MEAMLLGIAMGGMLAYTLANTALLVFSWIDARPRS
jgi:surfactin synthase thioesterase subunit